MEFTHVNGNNKGKLTLYALSTCIWCKKTKALLEDMGVEYSYVFVDLLNKDDNAKATEEIKKWNPGCTFPTLVINGEKCIVGFKEDEIKKELN